mmetsp:Transcript_32677/g.91502  ORF Transcript_32677/g.91502 Transcript_32677/m.91502 type:complete len:192 (+) Transcript_32677:147-722(+)
MPGGSKSKSKNCKEKGESTNKSKEESKSKEKSKGTSKKSKKEEPFLFLENRNVYRVGFYLESSQWNKAKEFPRKSSFLVKLSPGKKEWIVRITDSETEHSTKIVIIKGVKGSEYEFHVVVSVSPSGHTIVSRQQHDFRKLFGNSMIHLVLVGGTVVVAHTSIIESRVKADKTIVQGDNDDSACESTDSDYW